MPNAIRRETFPSLRAEWQALLPNAHGNTIFFTPQWQHTWWEHAGPGAELCLTAVRTEGQLDGIAPLMRRDNVISFIGSADLFDYHDFVVRHGREQVVYPALGEFLEEEAWHLLDLDSIPEGSPTLRYLPDLFRQRGHGVTVEAHDIAPGVSVPASWEEYLGGLRKKDRHELRRKLRRLEEAGAYSCRYGDPERLEEEMDTLFGLMRMSRDDKRTFLTPERERFFRSVAGETARMGALRLFFMEVEGEEVAAVMGFDYANTRLLYNSGYHTAYSSLSVGLLLKALYLQNAIHDGLDYFDFLKGLESYKYHLGGRDVLLYRVRVERR